ncbi:hypothetical protein [Soonwooa sp.]|uniref:hypothetical protein n=1 Tax=Soonwooa sp. TaxID=1938592 RepID=UPI00262782A7|nr:hypothetical protein [Soonwooa sp.]
MKKSLLILAVASLVACKKNEEPKTDESSTSIGDVVNGAKTLSNLSASMDDIQKSADKLKTVKPLSNDEIKAALPENVIGLKRTEYNAGDNMMVGLITADAKYSDGTEKNVRLNIMDGAGESGSAVVTMIMMGLKAESEKNNEQGYEKTTNFNNTRAIISEHKNGDLLESKITYLLKDRYVIKIEADGYTVDQLKPIMDEINVSALK